MKRLFFVVFCALFCTFESLSQSDTDIFVYELKEKKGKVTLGKGENVTKRPGYDNQPHFFGVDYLLYTEQENGQTDIVMLDLYENKKTNLTQSKESEYSAEMVPGFDSFAAVRVEEDQTQRLWLFHLNTKKKPQLVFEDLAPVGYHAWNGSDVATFVLGNPITLVLTNAKERYDRKITDNIGRTLRAMPGTPDFAFERAEENGRVNIYRLSTSNGAFDLIVQKPEKASDWTITKEGTFVTSVGSKLLTFNPKYDKHWVEAQDLGNVASKGITRMAVNEDNKKIALVINQ